MLKQSLQRISLMMFTLVFCAASYAQTLAEKLKDLSPISNVEMLKSADHLEKLVCTINQQVDWQSNSAGNFEQRIIIKHRGFDKPTVMVTEGYDASYALRLSYQEELANILNANLVVVEHRYFNRSVPAPCNWNYLTVANSAGDYHNIRQLLGKIYPGKWFTTGISKGGSTTIYYRAFYPNDVDGTVAYVAPINKSLEDGRHEPFLKNIKNEAAKKAVFDFQTEVLKRRNTIQPEFEKYCNKKGYTYRTNMSEIFDLCVLEYEFAFWQWGTKYTKIPPVNSADEVLLKHLVGISDPDYFSEQGAGTPFNVQAMREIGYYGYDCTPFKDYLSIDHAEGYMRRVMIPENLSHIEFDTNLYEKTMEFLKKSDVPMIFIYGENDPWTSTGVTWLKDLNKKNMHIFIDPEGSHLARISTMPHETYKKIVKILEKWTK